MIVNLENKQTSSEQSNVAKSTMLNSLTLTYINTLGVISSLSNLDLIKQEQTSSEQNNVANTAFTPQVKLS